MRVKAGSHKVGPRTILNMVEELPQDLDSLRQWMLGIPGKRVAGVFNGPQGDRAGVRPARAWVRSTGGAAAGAIARYQAV